MTIERSKKAQALASFNAYLASEPERLAAFRRAVEARGGPRASELDLTRESLGPLGAWFLQPPPPGPEDLDPPDWARDGPVDPAAWLRDGLASYIAAVLRREFPIVTWRMDDYPRSFNYGKAVLVGIGPVERWPVSSVSTGLKRTRESKQPDPDWLIRHFDDWVETIEYAAQWPAVDTANDDLEAELDEVEVGPIKGDRDWNAEIWITEAAEPLLGEREYEALERRFAALGGVERLAWEDREHFLLRVRRGTKLARLRDEVVAALHAALAASRVAS